MGRLRWSERCWVTLGIAVVACGGRAGLEGVPGASSDAKPGASDLAPPANIDSKVCEGVLIDAGASGSTKLQGCIDCCARTEFRMSTVYDGQCLCGKLLDRSGALTCSGVFFTQDQCSSCCTQAGFGLALGPSGDVASCACVFKIDRQVCDAAVRASEPETACQLCCLNHGYLSAYGPTAVSPHCECIDGS